VRWALVSEFWREAVLGVLILLSVAADALLMRRFIASRQAREHRRAEEKVAQELSAQSHSQEASR
jgi:rhamnose transport system permease protein